MNRLALLVIALPIALVTLRTIRREHHLERMRAEVRPRLIEVARIVAEPTATAA